MTEYERFGLVFTKTRVDKFGHMFCLVSLEDFLQNPVSVPNEVDNLVFGRKLQGIRTHHDLGILL
jgi:hypothetical protein